MFGTPVTPESTLTATSLAASVWVAGAVAETDCVGADAFAALVLVLLPPPPPPPHAASKTASAPVASSLRNESECRMTAPLLNDADMDASRNRLRQIGVTHEGTQMAA